MAGNTLRQSPQDGELENPGRRDFIVKGTILATSGLAAALIMNTGGTAKAQEAEAPVQLAAYAESQLGINYSEFAKSPLDAMLAAGEAEWMGNPDVKAEYGEDMAEVWQENAVLIAKEKITQGVLEEIVDFTPQLLLQFASLDKSKYPFLNAIGTLRVQDQESYENSVDILERARLLAGVAG